MRLTALLFRRNRMPHGHIWSGKDRFVKEVTEKHTRNKLWRLEIEERNMLLLRHPFLSQEQSHGHAKALNKHEKFIQKHTDYNRLCRKDDITIGERLIHLNVKDAWENY